MKLKIESNPELRDDINYDLDNIFHNRDLSYSGGSSPFTLGNLYQYSTRYTHFPSGISIQIYDTSIKRDDEELLIKMKLEAYEELRYLVSKSPRYLWLLNNKTMIRNRLLGFVGWEENEK